VKPSVSAKNFGKDIPGNDPNEVPLVKRTVSIMLATVSMYLVAHLVVFLAAPVALYYVFTDNQPRITRMKKYMADLLFRILAKDFHIVHPENTEAAKTSPVISNYPSFYTFPALLSLFPDASMVAAAFIARIPVVGFILGRIGAVYVDPGRPRATKQALDHALARGVRRIILFPEGHRSARGEMDKFQKGFLYMLRHSSLDLLPVTANGFFRLKPANRMYIDPAAPLELIVHAPLRNATLREMTDDDAMEKIRRMIAGEYRP
jgi:1-acyl-sn-glycerol-3-phosphate acyltransferase